jgi:hypothetical protein
MATIGRMPARKPGFWLLAGLLAVPGCAVVFGMGDVADDLAVGADASDARSDSQPSVDGAPPIDGSTSDAGADSSPCRDFCDDFDHAPLGTLWASVPRDGGALTLAADASVSAPNALRIACGLGQHCGIEKIFDGSKTKLHIELDTLLVKAPAAGTTYEVFSVTLAGGDGQKLLVVYAPDLQAYLCDPTGCYVTQPMSGFSTQHFVHIVANLDMAGGAVDISVDGIKYLADAGLPAQAVGGIRFNLGNLYDIEGAPSDIRIDNVIVERR